MAARTFRERKKKGEKKPLIFRSTKILMSTLTWITRKELEREINNNGEQFRLKKNMKII